MLLCWWRCRHRALLLVHSVLLMLRQDTTCHRRVRFHRREPPTRRPIHHRRSPASRNSAPLSPGSRWTAPTSLPADLACPAAETHLSRCSTQLNGHPHYGLHWSSVRVSWSISTHTHSRTFHPHPHHVSAKSVWFPIPTLVHSNPHPVPTKVNHGAKVSTFDILDYTILYYWNQTIKGALHELNQMVNLTANHLVKCRRVARDPNPQLKLT